MVLFVGFVAGYVGDGDLWAQARKPAQSSSANKGAKSSASSAAKKPVAQKKPATTQKKTTAQKSTAGQSAANKKKEDINEVSIENEEL